MAITTHKQEPLHIAILTTAYYEFMAGGNTVDQARATLRHAWDVHAAQTGATYTWDDVSDDVTVVTLRAGEALRDISPIIPSVR